MTISSSHAALSARTVNAISGHEPRLSAKIEQQISQTSPEFNLFQFEFDGIDYDDSNIEEFTISPILYSPLTLKQAIIAKLKLILLADEATDVDDDDGFTLSTINPLTVKILDSKNRDITSWTNTFCDAANVATPPYRIEISGGIRLNTQYGSPAYKDYTAATLETNKKLPLKQYALWVKGVCYAQPNILLNNTGNIAWESNKGFKVQSETDASKNFPTTGFNGAWFNLNVTGINATELVFQSKSITQGNVTATITTPDSNSIRIELSGPSSGQRYGLGPVKFIPPGPITIQDSQNKIKYTFDIKQWFIPRSGTIRYDTSVGAQAYCENLTGDKDDYRVPTRADYSNSPYADANNYPPYPITNGTNAIRGQYKRAIGQGVFSEWGYIDGVGVGYANSDWQRSNGYWTSEAWSSKDQYTVSTGSGYVIYYEKSNTGYSRVACISN